MPPRMMDGAAQIATTYLPASAIVRTASVTRLSAYRLVVPGMPPGRTSISAFARSTPRPWTQVGYDIDAACTAHGIAPVTPTSGISTPARAQKIDRSQRLDFLKPSASNTYTMFVTPSVGALSSYIPAVSSAFSCHLQPPVLFRCRFPSRRAYHAAARPAACSCAVICAEQLLRNCRYPAERIAGERRP